MKTDTYVRARIARPKKKRAADTLALMWLSLSDAIRLLMIRVADERRLPFQVGAPNAAELESGNGRRPASTRALIADLNAVD
jgi:DNA-damage-inducible protein J